MFENHMSEGVPAVSGEVEITSTSAVTPDIFMKVQRTLLHLDVFP